MRLFLSLSLIVAALLRVSNADPVITEFMASNQASIADENGDHSDWVEIYNPDSVAVSLENWSITDNASKLRKWIFPAITIPAKSYLIVWASGKDRSILGQNLHTNFSLSADGEYLALVKPDGVTRTTEFAPAFPPQVGNVSYGKSGTIGSTALILQGAAARALVPATAGEAAGWTGRMFNDSAWIAGSTGVGFFNVGGTSNPDLSAQLGLNLGAQMGGNGKSAYIRVPFSITDPAKVLSLKLRMYYDDGFAAYINGMPAASANVPTPLNHNSNASATHSPTALVEYDLAALIPQLSAGGNVLAIQALNSVNSTDCFMQPELVAQVDFNASYTGYFTVATPDAANGGPDTIQLPQIVTFSRGPGTFSTSFTLTLSGAVAGQQIRYILADPSGDPGANIAEPTGSSTLYTGPITISTSKIIRACVYDPVNGQRGVPSTAQYLLLETGATNNTAAFTSSLPLVVVDDHGDGMPVDSSTNTYTPAMLYVFDRDAGGAARLDATPAFSSRAGFRVRGRTSSTFPKKSYGVETWDEKNNDRKTSLLGLSPESDWILTGPWLYDDVFFHNAYIFELSRRIGRWAPRTRLVEVFANTNGGKLDYSDYAGVYQLTEKIESGSNRLDIPGIEQTDVSGDALTGGYIFKIDEADPGEVTWTTARGHKPVIVEPDHDQDMPVQITYLQNYIQTFEYTVYAERSANFATRNYRKCIDVGAWVDHSILNSLACNVDAFRLSAYFHKDRNGKIAAGPIWDFDRALNSDDGRDANPRSWDTTWLDYIWWGELTRDPDFVQTWVDRWWQLRSGPFSNTNLNALADALGGEIGAAAGARDAARWPDNTPESGSYPGEVAALKTWLTSTDSANLGRAPWIDTQIPGPPSASRDSAVVSPGTTVSLSGTGTIRYMTSGSDPRPAGGGATSGAATYSTPLTVNQTTVLTARRTGSFAPFAGKGTTIGWSAPLQRVYLVNETFAAPGDLAVSEINYDPAEPGDAERAAVQEVAATDFEFIELRNVSDHAVNTFGVVFADTQPARETVLSPRTLAPGDTALVVRNREAFVACYGAVLGAKIVGEWGIGSLNNGGEHIRILSRAGDVLLDFIYADLAMQGLSLNHLGAAWKSDVPSPGAHGPSYVAWRNYYFPNGGIDAGDSADPDTDNAGNAVEYGRGTNPTTIEAALAYEPVFSLSSDGASYAFTFRKPVNRPDAIWQVQSSEDLLGWTNVADSLVSSNGEVETRAAAGSADGKPVRFFRLKMTIAP